MHAFAQGHRGSYPKMPKLPMCETSHGAVRPGLWLTYAVAATWLLLVSGCSDVLERFDSPNYPRGAAEDYASDLDYCDQIARATLHARGEIDTDIGRELETDHTTQGPDTLERNMRSSEERREFQQIVADCLRHRRESRPVGPNR